MSKSIFEKLRELEEDNLTFPGIDHGPGDLRIEAISTLKETTLDVIIREKLSGIGLSLENMRCKSSQDIPPVLHGGPWCEPEIDYWNKVPQRTCYTFLYDIAKVTSSEEILADQRTLGDLETCPDCNDGFYTPFVGPRETCKTCDGTNMVLAEESPALQPSMADDLKDDFGLYVAHDLHTIDLDTCRVVPFAQFSGHDETHFMYTLPKSLVCPPVLWDGHEFGRHFCEALRLFLLNQVIGKAEVQLHFAFDTLKISYDPAISCYEMSMDYHLRTVI